MSVSYYPYIVLLAIVTCNLLLKDNLRGNLVERINRSGG